MLRVARRTETTNSSDFWAAFWNDPSKLVKHALKSTFSGLFIEYCEKNDFAIRVHVAAAIQDNSFVKFTLNY